MNAPARVRPTIQRDPEGRILYAPNGQTLVDYLLDSSPIAVIRGPWGSGKTVASVQRIWRHAVEQNYSTTGGVLKRRSRWFIMRESYPRIFTTTLKTWLEYFPERLYGKLFTGERPYRHEIRVGDIELDVFFGAQDDSSSDAMFKSLEPTGWYWNELEFTSMESFFAAHGRVGRFPRAIDGGSKWSGSIADTNAPGDNHWLPLMMGEAALPDDMSFDRREAFKRPPGFQYYVQPPAMFEVRDAANRIIDWRLNPAAENLKWLTNYEVETDNGEEYYDRARRGKTIRWIWANLCNRIVATVEGDPVYPSWDEQMHASTVPLEPVAGEDVAVGLDFGRRPAALFSQTINGQRQIQFEAGMENAGATKFAPVVRELIARHYPWVFLGRGKLRVWGDPKGQDGTQADEQTAYDVFHKHGLMVRPAPVKQNNIQTRIEALEFQLSRLIGGRPAYLVSPRCSRYRTAMGGGYHYANERPAPMTERKPVKDRYSDYADAGQYLELGEGAGLTMVGRESRPSPVSTKPASRNYRRGQ